MEIYEDEDFGDEAYDGVHDVEEDENEVATTKKRPLVPNASSGHGHQKPTEEVEMLDATGRPQKKLPLIEKYRPTSLEEVVAQDDIVQTIMRLMDKKALPHLLLYGPPGTGKT